MKLHAWCDCCHGDVDEPILIRHGVTVRSVYDLAEESWRVHDSVNAVIKETYVSKKKWRKGFFFLISVQNLIIPEIYSVIMLDKYA